MNIRNSRGPNLESCWTPEAKDYDYEQQPYTLRSVVFLLGNFLLAPGVVHLPYFSIACEELKRMAEEDG